MPVRPNRTRAPEAEQQVARLETLNETLESKIKVVRTLIGNTDNLEKTILARLHAEAAYQTLINIDKQPPGVQPFVCEASIRYLSQASWLLTEADDRTNLADLIRFHTSFLNTLQDSIKRAKHLETELWDALNAPEQEMES